MPRAIMVRVTCDVCAKEDLETPAMDEMQDELSLGKKKVLLDLCETHQEGLMVALEPYLAAGVKASMNGAPTTAAGKPLDVECPHPECGKMYSGRQRMMNHFRSQHGSTLAEWEASQGLRTDVYACEEPGCGRQFSKIQGLGRHKLAAHGIPGESRKTPSKTTSKTTKARSRR